MKTKLLICSALACIAFEIVQAQNAIPDSLFGNNSLLQKSIGNADEVSSLLIQPDGLFICGGYDYDNGSNDYHINMLRFDQCGDPDISFGDSGSVHHKFSQRDIGYDFKLQQDGKIVVAGQEAPSNAGSQQIPCVSRFNSDGSIDSTFNNTGNNALRFDAVSSGAFYSVHMLPDSRIVCIGTCSANANGGVNSAGVMRFNPDGSLDTTFSGDGKVNLTGPVFSAYSEVYGHILQNGKIIVTAATWDGSFVDHFFVFCYDSTGVQDTTFGVSGNFSDTANLDIYTNGLASALQDDEKILLAANGVSQSEFVVLRLLPSGILDTTFGVNGRIHMSVASMIASEIRQLNNGNILIMGTYNSNRGCGVMLDQDGRLDTTFGSNGFRIFDLTNGSGSNSFNDLLELSSGDWLVASGKGDFRIKKYTDQSNVPHITQNGLLLTASGTGTYQWFRGDTLLTGETNASYFVTQNGTYRVELTDAQTCTYLSDSVRIVNVGISEMSQNNIRLFPNPASNKILIQSDKMIDGMLFIYAIDGSLAYEGRINSSTIEINLDKFYSGIYELRLISEKAILQKKLIINK